MLLDMADVLAKGLAPVVIAAWAAPHLRWVRRLAFAYLALALPVDMLAAYLGGWFLGFWTGNFSLLLFVLTVVTLGFWLAAEGALLVYLAIIAAYVVAMDRLEAAYLAEQAATSAGAAGPGPESA